MNGWKRLIFEIVIVGTLAFGGWLIAGIHDQVYTEIPEHYVKSERLDDLCQRLDRIENKVDSINEFLRNE